LYFKLSNSEFARDLKNTLTQNPNTQKGENLNQDLKLRVFFGCLCLVKNRIFENSVSFFHFLKNYVVLRKKSIDLLGATKLDNFIKLVLINEMTHKKANRHHA
jgi:hypothetical protein